MKIGSWNWKLESSQVLLFPMVEVGRREFQSGKLEYWNLKLELR